MTRTFTARFDGKAIVPETPVDLPQGQPLTVTVEPAQTGGDPKHGTLAYIMKHRRGPGVSDEDAKLMKAAIEEACERTDFDPPVDFDATDSGHKRSG